MVDGRWYWNNLLRTRLQTYSYGGQVVDCRGQLRPESARSERGTSGFELANRRAENGMGCQKWTVGCMWGE